MEVEEQLPKTRTAEAETRRILSPPERHGFDSARLQRLSSRYQQGVSEGEIPGAVILIARNNEPIYEKAFGFSDRLSRVPMTLDTVFALASMTKPVTSVAAMLLVEEGRLGLDEPVSRYLPQLSALQVLAERGTAGGAGGWTLEPAVRELTVQDLLRHTAGFVYGQFGDGPVHKAYREANVWSADLSVTKADCLARLATMPLAHQPGTTFEYSVATDVLGYVVEAVSGKALDDFVSERISKPLGLGSFKYHVDPAAPIAWDPAYDRSSGSGNLELIS